MNNALLYGGYEFIETQSFSILNKRDAHAALERQQGHMISAEDASESEIREINVDLPALGNPTSATSASSLSSSRKCRSSPGRPSSCSRGA